MPLLRNGVMRDQWRSRGGLRKILDSRGGWALKTRGKQRRKDVKRKGVNTPRRGGVVVAGGGKWGYGPRLTLTMPWRRMAQAILVAAALPLAGVVSMGGP